jgi:hypothetical protein
MLLVLSQKELNRNFGTVTSAGSKLPGIVFTPPSTGRYYICALAQASNDTSSNYSAYSMTDGTTEIAQGSSRYPNIISTPICGIYNAASVASTTIKLQLKSIAGGNAIIDGSRSNAIEWSIYSLDQAFPAPVLVGSITSNSTGAERLERAAVTSTCSASPCTIASQSGSWLTNITRASTGNYSINFAAGMFSAAPTCNIIANGLIATINTNPTTSAVVIDTKNTAGTSTDAQFFVQCMGPR